MKKTLQYLLLFLVIAPFYAQTIPSYYNGLDLTKTGDELFLELSTRLIDTHIGIPYTSSSTDTWDVLKQVDEDPDKSSNVLLIYGFNDTDGVSKTDRTRDKDLRDTGGGDIGKWNREHVFAKSLADPRLSTDDPGPGTDVHNLKPADSQQNSSRSNRKFTDGTGDPGIDSDNGGWYPGDEWKGDVARIIMYMYLRYHGDGSKISQTQCLPINIGFDNALSTDPNMIDLFLRWNVEDPVSDYEDQRNPTIEGIQGNRNPFIDNPYLATLIWGGSSFAQDRWDMINPSDVEPPTAPKNVVASNITTKTIDLTWDASTDNNVIIDYLIYENDVYLQTSKTTSTAILNLTGNTLYSFSIKARDGSNNLSDPGVVSAKTIAYSLPSDNFEIETISESCKGKNNGQIVIKAKESGEYMAMIDGINYVFSSNRQIEDLAAGNYEFCISVIDENYEQCYKVVIEEGVSVAGKANITSKKVDIEMTNGTAPFNVKVNNEVVFKTFSPSFSVDVNHGDLVEVNTNIKCEGVFSKSINLIDSFIAYPNPTKGLVDISLPISEREVVIELYNIHSQLISSKSYPVVFGKTQLNIENNPKGVYIAKVLLTSPAVLKIVKN